MKLDMKKYIEYNDVTKNKNSQNSVCFTLLILILIPLSILYVQIFHEDIYLENTTIEVGIKRLFVNFFAEPIF